MTNEEVALAELKQLQDIIARQDGFKDKTKNLAVTLFSAVSVGFFSGQLTLSPWQYVLASLGICFKFMALEGLYGMAEINAEERSSRVEGFLRNRNATAAYYDGPIIRESMMRGFMEKVFRSMRRLRTLSLYGFLLLLSFVAATLVPPSKHANSSDITKQLRDLEARSERLEQHARP